MKKKRISSRLEAIRVKQTRNQSICVAGTCLLLNLIPIQGEWTKNESYEKTRLLLKGFISLSSWYEKETQILFSVDET